VKNVYPINGHMGFDREEEELKSAERQLVRWNKWEPTRENAERLADQLKAKKPELSARWLAVEERAKRT
jgi:hypothetical protein